MKKTALVTLMFICWIAVGVVCVQPIKAQYQGNIAINADGSVTPSTAPIQQTGNTYTLTNDLQGDIFVNANNTVVDGNQHIVNGECLLIHVSNVTVKNFIVDDGFGYFEALGINLASTTNVTIFNNTIKGFESIQAMNGITYAGIYIANGKDNIIKENTLLNNLNGIIIESSYYNQIVGNNIIGDIAFTWYRSFGLYIEDSFNNSVYHNNFVNNTVQVVSSNSSNIWDDEYPHWGNYWSDYHTRYPSAVQMGASGVGDTAYVIDEQNTDRYPLMEPFNSTLYALRTTPPEIVILSMANCTYNQSTISLQFTLDKTTVWMGYSLDGKQNVTITDNVTIASIPNGLHSMAVYANDTYGNMGASESITFRVKLPEPFPIATVAAIIGASAVAIAGAGLIIFRKRKRQI